VIFEDLSIVLLYTAPICVILTQTQRPFSKDFFKNTSVKNQCIKEMHFLEVVDVDPQQFL